VGDPGKNKHKMIIIVTVIILIICTLFLYAYYEISKMRFIGPNFGGKAHDYFWQFHHQKAQSDKYVLLRQGFIGSRDYGYYFYDIEKNLLHCNFSKTQVVLRKESRKHINTLLKRLSHKNNTFYDSTYFILDGTYYLLDYHTKSKHIQFGTSTLTFREELYPTKNFGIIGRENKQVIAELLSIFENEFKVFD
jgi:hypothetical protein